MKKLLPLPRLIRALGGADCDLLKMIRLTPTLTILLACSTTLMADWQARGGFTNISGNASELATAVSLDVPPPGADSSLRFGPVAVDPSARGLNVEADVLTSIPGKSAFRITLYLTSGNTFPERPEQVLARTNRTLKGDEKGIIGFNATLPKVAAAGKALNAFIEISSCDLDRSGKPGPASPGKVSVRNLSLLGSTLPPSPSARERCRSYLTFAGRNTTAGTPGTINNKTALRLPGLLASIVDVKSGDDPRLARFMAETSSIIKGLRDKNVRLGPFEIYFPIANHVAAKRILGSILTSHPAYREYEKTIFEFQCLWADYKSNGSDSPKSPIPDAKTIADVPANIDNGNFRLLVTAAGYLAAQEFPDLKTRVRNPKTGAERVLPRDQILHEMDLYIRRVYHSITTRNTSEYGSQTYLAIDFAPVRMIAEHATDPEIKQIASRTLDWLHSSLAASMNQGHYINSAARSKGEFLGTGSGLGFLGWLAFDTRKAEQGITTPFCIYLALPGTYQIPPTIRPHDSFPFVKRETVGEGGNLVAVYTYQSKSFGLTNSIESRNPSARGKATWDRDGFYKEAARHKLNWLGAKASGFSPQWQNSAQPYAGRRDQPNGRYYGLNPWSCVLQHRGTQIGLSDVREGYPFRKLYVAYPQDGSIRERIQKADSGWTLCHTGRMIFAFRALKPPTLANDPKTAGSITDWYDYKKSAWILEAIEAPASPGDKSPADLAAELEKFHKTLLTAKTEFTHLDDADRESPTLTYNSPVSGRTLKLDAATYPIPADGEGVPIARYPVLATFPDDKSAPRILQEKDTLLWLDGSGKPDLTYHFQLPEK